MADYIKREAAATYAPLPKELREYQTYNLDDAFEYGYDFAIQQIDAVPAADVVEVDVKDLRVKKAIQTLCEFYSTAKKSDYVQKPLAWALYQTWKSFDKMDGGVNDAAD